MGVGETHLEYWAYGMSVSTITLGIFLLVVSALSIAFVHDNVHKDVLQNTSIAFLILSIGAMAIGALAIYKIYKLHKLYVAVINSASEGKIQLVNKLVPKLTPTPTAKPAPEPTAKPAPEATAKPAPETAPETENALNKAISTSNPVLAPVTFEGFL
jgi:hypothetical protein